MKIIIHGNNRFNYLVESFRGIIGFLNKSRLDIEFISVSTIFMNSKDKFQWNYYEKEIEDNFKKNNIKFKYKTFDQKIQYDIIVFLINDTNSDKCLNELESNYSEFLTIFKQSMPKYLLIQGDKEKKFLNQVVIKVLDDSTMKFNLNDYKFNYSTFDKDEIASQAKFFENDNNFYYKINFFPVDMVSIGYKIKSIHRFDDLYSHDILTPLLKFVREIDEIDEIKKNFEILKASFDNLETDMQYQQCLDKLQELEKFPENISGYSNEHWESTRVKIEKKIIHQKSQEQIDLFQRILKRTNSITLIQLSDLLQMDQSSLLRWLYSLPDKFGFKVNTDRVDFSEVDMSNSIDELLKSYENFREKKII